MSFFKMDEVEEVKGFELPKPGKYEVSVINTEAKKTQAGKDMLSVDFEIRSDVPQDHQGAKILYNNFTFEHPTSRGIAKSLLKAAGFPESHNFSSCDEMAKGLIGKTMEIGVKHEEDNKGNTYPKSSYYNPSNANPPAQIAPPVVVGDSDLPF